MVAQTQVIYTVGILVCLILILLFLRALLLRRARALSATTAHPQHTPEVVVVGGGWRDGGIGGVGGRPYRVPTDLPRQPPPAATVPGRMRGGDGGEPGENEGEMMEDLPRYEAPPPEYESVVKDSRRGVEAVEVGQGGSSGGDGAHRGDGDVVIEMGQVVGSAERNDGRREGDAVGVPSPAPQADANTDARGVGSRFWGRLGR